MSILIIFRRLGSACTLFVAPHGAVIQQAHQRHNVRSQPRRVRRSLTFQFSIEKGLNDMAHHVTTLTRLNRTVFRPRVARPSSNKTD